MTSNTEQDVPCDCKKILGCVTDALGVPDPATANLYNVIQQLINNSIPSFISGSSIKPRHVRFVSPSWEGSSLPPDYYVTAIEAALASIVAETPFLYLLISTRSFCSRVLMEQAAP